MIKSIYHPNSLIRYRAIEALGDLEDKSAIYDILGALEDEDESVRHMAVYSLGEIGINERQILLLKKSNMREVIFRKLQSMP